MYFCIINNYISFNKVRVFLIFYFLPIDNFYTLSEYINEKST